MTFTNILNITSRNEFRQWLMENHRTASECWVALKRGRPEYDRTDLFWYLDAVEEALCFGWIDSLIRKQGDRTLQKFSPRNPKGNWTELNKERCRRLERLGLMTEAGRAVWPDMSAESFTIDTEILQELQADPTLWHNFLRLPELYRRIRIDRIQFLKVQHAPVALYRARLDKFIENTRQGVLYGEWNDYGRLP